MAAIAGPIAMQAAATVCLIILVGCPAALPLIGAREASFRGWCKAPSSQAPSTDEPADGTAQPAAAFLRSQLHCYDPSASASSSWLLPEAHMEAGTAQLGAQARLRAAMHRFLVQNKSLTVGFVGKQVLRSC